ncbi:ABC transporter [Bifidobacterium sp. UTCIF-37]|uniref:ATP-binding cassette domain-containing protein n=1 Tax=unclassified Bifidobacterium TaxID=2608897 RepID=UPI001125B729|nr:MULTISPECIES: ATP-binding cassette domain-containing protein [unclassified Bifidobacterium]TPF87324.1 ABC transporter [Bifidobacterium sp. UTCIF-37]TPF91562.1 ABC transporter [Bifidobacterium sp. UTCIF-38]
MNQLPDSASPIIAFENVSFNHAERALHGISFSVYAGRVTVLIGPRHSGKTTVLRMLLGLDIPDGGRISVCGRPIDASTASTTAVSVIPETVPHPSYCSAGTYLRWKALWAGTSNVLLDDIVRMTGLRDLLPVKLRDLDMTGIVKMRFAIALLTDPKALIVDEPLRALDKAGVQWVCGQMRRQADRGVAMLVASEPDYRLKPITDDVVMLDRGTVEKEGSLSQLQSETAKLSPDGVSSL